MGKKDVQKLPAELRYLQPFLRALAKRPAEELDEDIDAADLEAALRKRLRGLDEHAADAELSKHRALLEKWLKTSASANHPVYWVLGFITLPGIGRKLVRPPEPPLRGPRMDFEPPMGWKVKSVPFRLDLKKGRVIGTIGAIDDFTFDLLQRQMEGWDARAHAQGLQASMESSDVTFGACAGKKYVYKQTGQVSWKRVDYLLRAPGGIVSVTLDGGGTDFNESEFESKLCTLRLSSPSLLGPA
jgi:hypothetical protein